MTFVVEAAVVACGLALGRVIARAARGRRATAAPSRNPGSHQESGRSAPATATATATATAIATATDAWAAFACRLGDVLVRRLDGDEAWLAGALVFSEQRPIAVLFVAPKAGGDGAVFVRDGALTWMSPLEGEPAASAREPPHAFEHAGVRFERTRRIPVAVERAGTGAPAVGHRAVLAEYTGPGADRVVVVAGNEAVLAWSGTALSEGEYDVLPGGPPDAPSGTERDRA